VLVYGIRILFLLIYIFFLSLSLVSTRRGNIMGRLYWN